MNALGRLTATEFRLFLRERDSLFWTLAFPVLLIVAIGALPSSRVFAEEYGARPIDYYTPVLLVMALGMFGVFRAPVHLVGYREQGVLRRLQTTPIGPGRVLVAQFIVQGAVTVLVGILVPIIATLAWAVPPPSNVPGFSVAYLLSAATVLTLGLLLAAVIRTSKAATGVASVTFFSLMVFAGLYIPVQVLPDPLPTVAAFTPMGAAATAIQSAMSEGWPGLLPVLVLVGWTLVLGAGSWRLFRWQ